MTQVRRLFRVINGGTPTAEPENWDGDHVWFTPEDLGAGRMYLSGSRRRLSRLGLRRTAGVPAGSLVVSTRAPIGYVAISRVPASTNQGCRSLVPLGDVDERFFYYQFLARRPYLESLGQGSTFHELSSDALASALIHDPPRRAQTAIADFLDAETAQIKALIEKRLRMLELLHVRMVGQSTALLLRGADGEVPDAPAGRFLPDPPPGWVATQLRHLGCEVQTGPFGSQLHAEDYVENGCPVVNPANLVKGRITPDWSTTVSEGKKRELERHTLRQGDIVFGRRGEMGRAGLVGDTEAGWLCGTGSLRLRFRNQATDPGYIKLLLETASLRAYFSISSVGSTMENLNAEILLAAPVLHPPLWQQYEIVGRIRDLKSESLEVVPRLTRQIALLRERRQALITAAVTGELDVTRGPA